MFDGQGYWLNDDTASGGVKSEDDVLGCAHCQKALKKKIWLDNGGYCSRCDQELCVGCATEMLQNGGICKNFKRFVEQQVELAYRREVNAKILGI